MIHIERIARRIRQMVDLDPNPPKLDISIKPEAAEIIRGLVVKSTGFTEHPFLGLGQDYNTVNRVIEPLADHQNPVHLTQHHTSTVSVGAQMLEDVFYQANQRGRDENVVVLGHTHPSGSVSDGRITYVVSPSESLLSPSTGYPNPLSGGDLAFYKAFRELNPQIPIPFVAIGAMTEDGPKLRLYDTEELLGVRRVIDIDHVRQITIPL